MDPTQALTLVRQKYLEEIKGISAGETAARYAEACRQFPALMSVAHQCLARELAKGLA